MYLIDKKPDKLADISPNTNFPITYLFIMDYGVFGKWHTCCLLNSDYRKNKYIKIL